MDSMDTTPNEHEEIVEALAPVFDFMIGPSQIACKAWIQTAQVLDYFGVKLPRELTEDEAIRTTFQMYRPSDLSWREP